MEKLEIRAEDPPVYVMVIPPFSPRWIEQMESVGAVPASDQLKAEVEALPVEGRREFGWDVAARTAAGVREAGAAGVILMGLRFDTVIDEAAAAWRAAPQPGFANRPAIGVE